MHGARRRKKSDYGAQLEERQKLKAVYGMLSLKCLRNYYRAAVKSPGNTSHEFLKNLECRLDVVVYRLRLATTIFHAQQLVAHGHVMVNGRKVDVRSYNVRVGDVISIREKSQTNPIVKLAADNTSREIPEYLEAEEGKFKGTMKSAPEPDQVPFPLQINVPLVCEFLAHTC